MISELNDGSESLAGGHTTGGDEDLDDYLEMLETSSTDNKQHNGGTGGDSGTGADSGTVEDGGTGDDNNRAAVEKPSGVLLALLLR